MIKNLHKTDYGLEGTMEYPLFKTEIDVLVSDKNYAEYAEKCASYLVNIPDETLIRLCRYITRYCDEYRSLLEDYMTVPSNTSQKDILNYIAPSTLIVDKPNDASVIGFHMEFGCDWEPEHGLEITIVDNKIMYVGSYDGMSPWNKDRLEYSGYYNENNDLNMNYADNES